MYIVGKPSSVGKVLAVMSQWIKVVSNAIVCVLLGTAAHSGRRMPTLFDAAVARSFASTRYTALTAHRSHKVGKLVRVLTH